MAALSQNTFTFVTSNLWGDAANWSGGVPVAADNVVILGTAAELGAPFALSNTVTATVNSVTTGGNGLNATLFIDAGQLTVTGGYTNIASTNIDTYYGGFNGGSTLTVGGTVHNSGSLAIGYIVLASDSNVSAGLFDNTGGNLTLTGSATHTAILHIGGGADFTGGAAPGTLVGGVYLSGNALIDFAATGTINTLAGNILYISGQHAFIATGAATGSNSAIDLTTINVGSTLQLDSGASVSSSGNLTNSGTIYVDLNGSGSSLNVTGTLTNSGGYLIASTTIHAGKLDNGSGGSISLKSGSPYTAALDVLGAADTTGGLTAGLLTGNIQLGGRSRLGFGSGKITDLDVNSNLLLAGAYALVTSGAALTTNSGLDLKTIGAGASLTIENGATIASSGDLANSGNVYLDNGYGTGGGGFSVTGTLHNSGSMLIGNPLLTAATTATVGHLDNTGGLTLYGSPTAHATLDIAGTADTTGGVTFGLLTGHVTVNNNASIVFLGGGQLNTLAASSSLTLNGAHATIDVTEAPGLNSALNLSTINFGANLNMANGASIRSTLDLTNAGNVYIDNSGTGGSSLSVTGTLHNTGFAGIYVGNTASTAGTSITVGGFDNAGVASYLSLQGAAGAATTFTVTGAAAGNNGSVYVGQYASFTVNSGTYTQSSSGYTTVAGTLSALSLSIGGPSFIVYAGGLVAGAGTISATTVNDSGTIEVLAGKTLAITNGVSGTGGVLKIDDHATLELGGVVGFGETIQFAVGGTAETLKLDSTLLVHGGIPPGDVTATIAGFAISDVIDLAGIPFGASVTAHLDSIITNQLDVFSSGVLVAALNLTGSYNPNVFETLSDGHGGTDIQLLGSGTVTIAQFVANQAYLDLLASGFRIADTAANVLAQFDALNADPHVTSITLTDAGTPALTLTVAQVLNDGALLAKVSTAHTIMVADTAAHLLSLPAARIAGIAGLGVTQLDATDQVVSLSLAQRAALGLAGIVLVEPYSGGTSQTRAYFADGTFRDIHTYGVTGQPYDNVDTIYYGGNVVQSVSLRHGTTLVLSQTWNTDGSIHDIHYYGITGQAYTDADYIFGANGKVASAVFSTASGVVKTQSWYPDGKVQDIHTYGITGQPYDNVDTAYYDGGVVRMVSQFLGATPVLSETWNTDASIHDIHYYGITGQAYTDADYVLGANGKVASAIFSGITGRSYTGYELDYDASGTRTFIIHTNTDSTHTIQGVQDGLTISGTSGNDYIYGGGAAETFLYTTPFGHDTIDDFAAHLTGANHDTLSLPTAPFHGNFSELLAATTFTSAGAMITVDAADTILLKGVTQAQMTANPGDFTFHA